MNKTRAVELTCFRIYRRAAKVAHWFRLRGWYRLDDAVYGLLPLRLCQIGYDVWKDEHPADFAAYLEGCQP